VLTAKRHVLASSSEEREGGKGGEEVKGTEGGKGRGERDLAPQKKNLAPPLSRIRTACDPDLAQNLTQSCRPRISTHKIITYSDIALTSKILLIWCRPKPGSMYPDCDSDPAQNLINSSSSPCGYRPIKFHPNMCITFRISR